MSRSRRIVPILIALASLAWAVSLGAVAEPAMADRCQPEELVLGPGNSPLGHDDTDPRCPVMQAAFYNQVSCDQTTFVKCVNSLSARGTIDRQVARVRGICLVREGKYCIVTLGAVIDRYLGTVGTTNPGTAVPPEVRAICLAGNEWIGCTMTVGDLVDRLLTP